MFEINSDGELQFVGRPEIGTVYPRNSSQLEFLRYGAGGEGVFQNINTTVVYSIRVVSEGDVESATLTDNKLVLNRNSHLPAFEVDLS